jgi:hypothetical protein
LEKEGLSLTDDDVVALLTLSPFIAHSIAVIIQSIYHFTRFIDSSIDSFTPFRLLPIQ